MSYRKKLFGVTDIYDTGVHKELFLRAVKENFHYLYHHCKEYRSIAKSFHISPDDVNQYEDIEKIPGLPTLLFKRHRLYSMPERRMLLKATSSGTKGIYSEIGFDAGALLCGARMVIKVCRQRDLLSFVPCNYIIFGYKPHKSNRSAAAKTAFGATLLAPALSRTYALVYEHGTYTPKLEQVIRMIERHSSSGFPLRLVGFPSYLFFALAMMEERGMRVKLPKGSKILLGGGWKQFYTKETDKNTFYDMVERVLGISDKDIVEFFSAVEHPILYCDCEHHHFHVPAYSRVVIRDVNTLKPCGYGEVGLVNLITPMVKATPLLSVITDDLGILHEGGSCGCGNPSPYLELAGRAGLRQIKTCAAGAAEFLSEETV